MRGGVKTKARKKPTMTCVVISWLYSVSEVSRLKGEKRDLQPELSYESCPSGEYTPQTDRNKLSFKEYLHTTCTPLAYHSLPTKERRLTPNNTQNSPQNH